MRTGSRRRTPCRGHAEGRTGPRLRRAAVRRAGSILFLRARERGALGFDHPGRGWIELTEGGTEVSTACRAITTTMHHPPPVAAVVERLRAAFDRVSSRAGKLQEETECCRS